MLRYGFITLFSTLPLLFPSEGMAQGLSLDKVESLSQGALPEIREHITRRLGCFHWEEAHPPAMKRTPYIKQAIRRLRCDDLNEQEALLRKVYAKHEPSIRALDTLRNQERSASTPTLQIKQPRLRAGL